MCIRDRDNVINKNETFTKLILTNEQINSLRAQDRRWDTTAGDITIASIRISPTFIVLDKPKKDQHGQIVQIPLVGHIFLFEDSSVNIMYNIIPFEIMIDLGKAPTMRRFFTEEYLGLYDTSRKMAAYFTDNSNTMRMTRIGTIDGTQYLHEQRQNVINMRNIYSTINYFFNFIYHTILNHIFDPF